LCRDISCLFKDYLVIIVQQKSILTGTCKLLKQHCFDKPVSVPLMYLMNAIDLAIDQSSEEANVSYPDGILIATHE